MEIIKEYVINKKKELAKIAKDLKLSIAIIQVGHVPASDRYVKNKIKDCEEIGITCKLIVLPETISEAKLLKIIKKLNRDKKVTGFIVQLPLPKTISEEKVKLAIAPEKDIDGFHPLNNKVAAATPAGIMMYLEDQKFDFSGKNAVILGRSNIVGKPMHKLLLDKNMNVTILHSYTTEEDKRFYLEHADLIIVATGCRNTITPDYKLKQTAVLMDVGINVDSNNKLHGDVEQELPIAFKSPVPSGCGLLTRLALLLNSIKLYKNKK